MSVFALRRLAGVLPLLVALAACAEPPTRELSTAQGAIDAARAAGAAEFAPEALAGAEQTLARAQASVTERDYRSALGHALDAHSRAQAAASAAAEGRVHARLAADERLDEFAKRIEEVETQLASAEAKRVPAATRRAASAAIAAALEVLRTTRQAVERGNLAPLSDVSAQTASLEKVRTSLTAPPPKRTRGRG